MDKVRAEKNTRIFNRSIRMCKKRLKYKLFRYFKGWCLFNSKITC